MSGFQRDQFEIESFGKKVHVPYTARAKLMYYLNCVNTVLDLSEISIYKYLRSPNI